MQNTQKLFTLNQRIENDTYGVHENDDYTLRLHKNALVAWLILVPKTAEVELFACESQFKQRIRETIDGLAVFSQDYFATDKMNIATIGNVVAQLHVHIIARKFDDFSFPDPVWGRPEFMAYDEQALKKILKDVCQYLKHVSS